MGDTIKQRGIPFDTLPSEVRTMSASERNAKAGKSLAEVAEEKQLGDVYDRSGLPGPISATAKGVWVVTNEFGTVVGVTDSHAKATLLGKYAKQLEVNWFELD